MTTEKKFEIALVSGKGGKDAMGRWHRPYLAVLRPNGQREWIGERGRKISNGSKLFAGYVQSGDVLEFRGCGTKGRQGHETRWAVVTDRGLVAVNRAVAHDLVNARLGAIKTLFAIEDGETALCLATNEVVATGCQFGGDCVRVTVFPASTSTPRAATWTPTFTASPISAM